MTIKILRLFLFFFFSATSIMSKRTDLNICQKKYEYKNIESRGTCYKTTSSLHTNRDKYLHHEFVARKSQLRFFVPITKKSLDNKATLNFDLFEHYISVLRPNLLSRIYITLLWSQDIAHFTLFLIRMRINRDNEIFIHFYTNTQARLLT